MRRILICGDRNWSNYARVLACVRKANQTEHIDVIIEGEARGADKMGRRAGEEIGLTIANGGILPFAPHWEHNCEQWVAVHGRCPEGCVMLTGKKAGVIRNQQQLDFGRPTECWAFHNDIINSRGTRDMVKRAVAAGLPTYIVTDQTTRRYPQFASAEQRML